MDIDNLIENDDDNKDIKNIVNIDSKEDLKLINDAIEDKKSEWAIVILEIVTKGIEAFNNYKKNEYYIKELKETEKTNQLKIFHSIIKFEKLTNSISLILIVLILIITSKMNILTDNLYAILGVIIGYFLKNDLGALYTSHVTNVFSSDDKKLEKQKK